jgi:hypothetical protein
MTKSQINELFTCHSPIKLDYITVYSQLTPPVRANALTSENESIKKFNIKIVSI